MYVIPPPSMVCVTLVSDIEAFKPVSYLDGKGPNAEWTLGYGTVFRPDGTKVKQGDTVTEPEAKQWLLISLVKIMQESLNKPLESITSLEQHQVDSLCSLIYNIGKGAFSRSTMLRLLKAKNFKLAQDQFLPWNKDHGKVVAGLTRRRITEREIFKGQPPWFAWEEGWRYIKWPVPHGNPFKKDSEALT